MGGENADMLLPESVPSDAMLGADDVAETSVQEQAILAEIQDLQRQLWNLQADEEDVEDTPEPTGKLIMVSNRLPVQLTRDEETGELDFKMTSGGLVTALSGVREDFQFMWIGWLGTEIPEDEQEQVRQRLREDFNLEPVFISEDVAELYYNGFANDVLWPLFHYEPLPSFKLGDERKFEIAMWEAYKSANALFADAIADIYEDGDLIWVHDYHHMVLPGILRSACPLPRSAGSCTHPSRAPRFTASRRPVRRR